MNKLEDLYGPLDEKKKKRKSKKRKGGKKDGKGSSKKGYTLRDWFKGDGWVQTGGKYDGKPCAKQPGQKTKPYCRDPDDRAKMSKKERDKRAAKKRREDPNPERRGKAKNVKQKKSKRKSRKNEELYMDLEQMIKEELKQVNEGIGTGILVTTLIFAMATRLLGRKPESDEEAEEAVNQLSDEEKREFAKKLVADTELEMARKNPDQFVKDGLPPSKPAKNLGFDASRMTPARSLEEIVKEELEAVLDEKRKKKKKKKKKKAKRDACYHKVKSRYKVWPSAYASGALVKCRRVGAKNWGNSKKESVEIDVQNEIELILQEGVLGKIKAAFSGGSKNNQNDDPAKWTGRKIANYWVDPVDGLPHGYLNYVDALTQIQQGAEPPFRNVPNWLTPEIIENHTKQIANQLGQTIKNINSQTVENLGKEFVKRSLNESHSKEDEEKLKDIVKALKNSSKMHGEQAEEIQGIVDRSPNDELDESHSEEDEETLKDIVGQLRKASKLHAGQAKKIQKIVDDSDDSELREEEEQITESPNCGCGNDPCDSYGKNGEKLVIMVKEEIEAVMKERQLSKQEMNPNTLEAKRLVNQLGADVLLKLDDKDDGSFDAAIEKAIMDYADFDQVRDEILTMIGAEPEVRGTSGADILGQFKGGLEEKKKKKKKKSAKDRMKCNSSRRIRKGEPGYGKKKFVVKACEGGTEKIIRYGDANMEIKKDSPKRRKSFRARHNCKNPGSKLKARYWSCKKW